MHKLVAGRVGQEFNQRKKRRGAFWEDRYHATAIESDLHLLRCLVYIDLNMVRNGVVSHPADWGFGGYDEIQTPKKKCVLISYDKLSMLAGFNSYESFRIKYKELVEERLLCGKNHREPEWTESIAVGSEKFVESIRDSLGVLAKGRKVLKSADRGFQLREEQAGYIVHSDSKMGDIGPENGYYWV